MPRQRKQDIDLALYRRDGNVFLVQRPRDARLMAGMWELPHIDFSRLERKQVPSSLENDKNRSDSLVFTVRHSITVTNYTVRVWDRAVPEDDSGKWVSCGKLSKMPLTGLARKVLRRAGVSAPET